MNQTIRTRDQRRAGEGPDASAGGGHREAAMRAGPDVKRDDPQSDQTIEEPGYGHGV